MEQVLYKLPDGWEWSNLTDVCTPSRKTVEPNPEEQYNYIGLENIESHTGKVISDSPTKGSEISSTKVSFKKGMVLYGKLRPYLNKVVVAKIDGIATTEIIPFECSDAISPDFLAYYLRSQYFVDLAMNNCSGARMPRATTKLFTQIAKVPVTSITEQKRIVEKLDALLTRIDTAIEHLQENLATSKSLLASALFEKFHQEVNPTPIKDIFNVYNGRAYKKTELLDSGKYKVIRIQNLKGGENYYYSDLELDENKYCESGDLLFSWSGTPGTSFGAFIWNDEKAIYHYHIWKMEPKVKIAPRYAYWVLKDITEEAIANARGVAGMLHITKGTMESFIVSLPSYEAQQKIAQELDELALKSEKLQVEISSKIDPLKHLKASILDSAFKGEL